MGENKFSNFSGIVNVLEKLLFFIFLEYSQTVFGSKIQSHKKQHPQPFESTLIIIINWELFTRNKYCITPNFSVSILFRFPNHYFMIKEIYKKFQQKLKFKFVKKYECRNYGHKGPKHIFTSVYHTIFYLLTFVIAFLPFLLSILICICTHSPTYILVHTFVLHQYRIKSLVAFKNFDQILFLTMCL